MNWFKTLGDLMGRIFLLVFLFFYFISGCQHQKNEFKIDLPLGLDRNAMYIPIDNPLSKDKIDLGRKLFFEERLSIDATISCAFCHNPLLSFGDGRYLEMGVWGQKGTRNSTTLLNRVFAHEQFLDGRAKSIEEVILEHIQNSREMDNSLDQVTKVLSADEYYREAFKKVFNSRVTADGLAKAIASFVRTLVSGDSPYDRFMAGDKEALSESAQRGLSLFKSERLNCMACHSGPNFTDENFHNNGAGQDLAEPDLGRYYVTKNDQDKGKFKTPTLRDISRTAPYMHNGSLKSLMDVVEFYNKGGISNPNLSDKIKPLGLTAQDKEDLREFLRSLNGKNVLFMGNL
jgi:cytochrome c peroxidase